jgi:hypothetical protein
MASSGLTPGDELVTSTLEKGAAMHRIDEVPATSCGEQLDLDREASRLAEAWRSVRRDIEVISARAILLPLAAIEIVVETSRPILPDDVERLARLGRAAGTIQRGPIIARWSTPVPVTPTGAEPRSRQRVLAIDADHGDRLALRLAAFERAIERDHRRVSKELELVSWGEASDAEPIWLPRGARLRATLERWIDELLTHRGFARVSTRNGDGAPRPRDLYRSAPRGRALLPLRIFEFTETPGAESLGESERTLRNLARSSDLHVTSFAPEDRIPHEIQAVVELAGAISRTLELEIGWRVGDGGVPPLLVETLASSGFEEAPARVRASIPAPRTGAMLVSRGIFGNLEHPFAELDIEGIDGEAEETRLDVHEGKEGGRSFASVVSARLPRSVDTLIAALLEARGGTLPPWLAPIQVRVLALARDVRTETLLAAERIRSSGLRCESDVRSAKLLTKERDAARFAIPFVARVGPQEIERDDLTLTGGTALQAPISGPFDEILARIIATSSPPSVA